jgi:hypothetical protein
MRRIFIDNNNPASPIASWEVSPCAETPDYHGGSAVEAFDTEEEARHAADAEGGSFFWGVYLRLSEEAIADGAGNPAIHLKDFDSYDEARSFVDLFTGGTDDNSDN